METENKPKAAEKKDTTYTTALKKMKAPAGHKTGPRTAGHEKYERQKQLLEDLKDIFESE